VRRIARVNSAPPPQTLEMVSLYAGFTDENVFWLLHSHAIWTYSPATVALTAFATD